MRHSTCQMEKDKNSWKIILFFRLLRKFTSNGGVEKKTYKKVDISQTIASKEVTEQQAYNEILFIKLVLVK